ncbi:MAG TPA: cyclic nucleotide-binding domain-containing protein [Wenzhouxiangella sp.]|nr:cyclic nucleotide-binding domain-containing protein [Wenzhouxiangella sp.]HLS05733.1 cyclic nucleotide-binding domain-containing protein [Wenzhouxiangella sp.]
MATENIAKLLKQSGFFSDLDAGHIDWLARHASDKRFDDGKLLARQGDRADQFFLVIEGELVVEVPALTGPSLTITRLGPGDIFGWSWLIEPYKWHFNGRAEESSRVLEFDGAAIMKHCQADSTFGYELLRRFSGLMGVRLAAAQATMKEQWAPGGLP